jgi:hypothetical protein
MVLSASFSRRVEARRRKQERLSRINDTAPNQNSDYDAPASLENGFALSDDAYQAQSDSYTYDDMGITGLIANIIAILVSCAVFTACVIFCYGYFTSGTASARWILVPAFLGICFFPFVVYGSAEKCVAFILARRRK